SMFLRKSESSGRVPMLCIRDPARSRGTSAFRLAPKIHGSACDRFTGGDIALETQPPIGVDSGPGNSIAQGVVGGRDQAKANAVRAVTLLNRDAVDRDGAGVADIVAGQGNTAVAVNLAGLAHGYRAGAGHRTHDR